MGRKLNIAHKAVQSVLVVPICTYGPRCNGGDGGTAKAAEAAFGAEIDVRRTACLEICQRPDQPRGNGQVKCGDGVIATLTGLNASNVKSKLQPYFSNQEE